jgi:hypothetical protein
LDQPQHLVPSNPQIAGGKNIDVLLRKTSGAEAADLRQAFDEAGAIVRQRELHYRLVVSPEDGGRRKIESFLASVPHLAWDLEAG